MHANLHLPALQGGILLPHEPLAMPPAAGGAAAQSQQQQQPFMLGPDNAEQPLQLQGRTVDGASGGASSEDMISVRLSAWFPDWLQRFVLAPVMQIQQLPRMLPGGNAGIQRI